MAVSPEVQHLLDLTPSELEGLLTEWGEPAYRSKQITRWLYKGLARSFDEMTDLSTSLRARLSKETTLCNLVPIRELESSDRHTRKWLFALPDETRVETVLMSYEKRQTACISTQVGCGMGCVFCATGRMGLKRNLSAGEIIEQVTFVARELIFSEPGAQLTNVVIMGMGEPFANYVNTMTAIRCLISRDGFDMGARRITVSTVGLVPAIDKFGREGFQVNLSVSLHAATDDLRSRLVPVNGQYPLNELIRSVEDYIDRTHRRVTFEWALIKGVNDTVEEAKALVSLVRDLLCHVNLIPVNPVEGYPGQSPPRRAVEAFRSELEKAGIPSTVRLRRGIDIEAGCGQLFAGE
jgi:23S rRNA (adenine2503-C2)-methyltransferase